MTTTAVKKIFVTGVTGNQGGAAARFLLQQNFFVKALVREPSAAKITKHNNLEIVKGDLNDPSSYHSHFNDIDGVFCSLTYTNGVEKEIKQGLNLIDVSKKNNVKHFVYASVIGNDLNTGIPHWESKFRIENHLKQSGLDFTILRPTSFYENHLIPQVRSRIVKGKLVLPTGKHTVQELISTEDVGRIAAIVFSNPGKYKGVTIALASEKMDGEQLAASYSNALGRPIKFQQLPSIITRLALGRDLAKMFKWLDTHEAVFVKDLESFKTEFAPMLGLEEWIRRHFK